MEGFMFRVGCFGILVGSVFVGVELLYERQAAEQREWKLQTHLEHARKEKAEHQTHEQSLRKELEHARKEKAEHQTHEQSLRKELEHARKEKAEHQTHEQSLRKELEHARKEVADQKNDREQKFPRELEQADGFLLEAGCLAILVCGISGVWLGLTELDQAKKKLAARAAAEHKSQTELEQTKKELAARAASEQKFQTEFGQAKKELAGCVAREHKLQTELDQAKKKLASRAAAEHESQTELEQTKKELAVLAASEQKFQTEFGQAKKELAVCVAREHKLQTQLDRAKKKVAARAAAEHESQTELEQTKKELAVLAASEQKFQTEFWQAKKDLAVCVAREHKLQTELDQAKKKVAARTAAEHKLQMELEQSNKELAVRAASEQKFRTEFGQAKKELAVCAAREQELRTELEQAKVQTASQKRAGFVWKWQGKNGEWCDFVPEDNKHLTEAFLQGKGGCEIIRDGIRYEITLAGQEMQQQNCWTRNCRKIRVALCLPEHWGPYETEIIERLMDEAQAQLGPSVTFQTVTRVIQEPQLLESFSQLLRESFFHDLPLPPGKASCPCLQNVVVREVHQVINYHLLQQYEGFCHRLRSDGHNELGGDHAIYGEALPKLARKLRIPLDAEINEQLLLHGTSFDVSQDIAIDGWDGRLARDGLYGRGTYFAVQSCKSHQYTKEEGTEALRTILLARVALGKPFPVRECDKAVRRPPSGYDSVVAKAGPMQHHQRGVQTHTEFIIFQHAGIQAMPEYILRYSLS